MKPLSMNSIDRTQANIEKIAELFPHVITETLDEHGKVTKAIDFDLLKQELSPELVEGDQERYQFTWPGKKRAILMANSPTDQTLLPIKEESVDWDTTENLYMEGDNLEVLKLLQQSHSNQIKMIYIDPPYNTGEDFIYKDNYNHSEWLTMIYARLKIARHLLKDDGVIFISIDDHELENLLKICNEIFNEKNFLVNCIWISGRTSSAHFTKSHEYVIGYAKNIDSLPLFRYDGEKQIITERTIKRPSAKNPVSSITFPAGIDFESEDKVFPQRFGRKEPVVVEKGIFQCENNKLKHEVTLSAAWTMKDMIESWLAGNTVRDQKGQRILRFYFKSNGVLQYEKEKGTIHPNSVISHVTTRKGTSEISSLFGKSIFSFPKPTELVKYFAPVLGGEDIVLDFFAGSATTADAIMQLNAHDGGKRKYILVQSPDQLGERSEAYKEGYKTICDIGKERIRRAANKIQKETKADIDYGFRVFRVEKI